MSLQEKRIIYREIQVKLSQIWEMEATKQWSMTLIEEVRHLKTWLSNFQVILIMKMTMGKMKECYHQMS